MTRANATLDAFIIMDSLGAGRTLSTYTKKSKVFTQGDKADAVFYIRSGRVALTVLSSEGRQAVVGLLGKGDFFGEHCIAGQARRHVTATALVDCELLRITKPRMLQLLRTSPWFTDQFVTFLLSRITRVEADLVDQLVNSCERRLARALLLLASLSDEGRPSVKISQEMLADMIGATRSRVSHFMNKFRKLGFISYNGRLQVHHPLLKLVGENHGVLLNVKRSRSR